jgi:hypothetical protein
MDRVNVESSTTVQAGDCSNMLSFQRVSFRILATASERDWDLVAEAWQAADSRDLLLLEFSYSLAAMGFDRSLISFSTL